jgi:hypothetical protein
MPRRFETNETVGLGNVRVPLAMHSALSVIRQRRHLSMAAMVRLALDRLVRAEWKTQETRR